MIAHQIGNVKSFLSQFRLCSAMEAETVTAIRHITDNPVVSHGTPGELLIPCDCILSGVGGIPNPVDTRLYDAAIFLFQHEQTPPVEISRDSD